MLLSNLVCLEQQQNIKYLKKHKSIVENYLYTNGNKSNVPQSFIMAVTYPNGEKLQFPAGNGIIDITSIPYIDGKYGVSFKYKNYYINANIPSNMFLSKNRKKNEPVIWTWNILENSVNDTLQVKCTLLLTLQESWIEMEIPAIVNVDDL
jgi:hypothetical protein